MKVALVHDWLTSPVGGAEKVLQAIHSLFPSPIYTLVKNEKALKGSYFENLEINSSFLQKLPFCKSRYQSYLPLFPLAIEQFDLSGYDVVISSSHCVAKGVLPYPDQYHISYCHTPMRYVWDLTHQYLKELKGMKKLFARWCFHSLRSWDFQASQRVDAFIAVSQFVAKRIKKLYGKEAVVIHPPVDIQFFEICEKKENYYVAASRFVPYKRIDLIVEAFHHLPDKELVVIGDGPEMKKIKQRAPKNVTLLGFQSDDVLKQTLQKARAFLYAAVEDFGILPIEAMACGTPVIAFGKGSLLETVISGKTGIFFREQTPFSLSQAIRRFESISCSPLDCRKRAEMFSSEIFQTSFSQFIHERICQVRPPLSFMKDSLIHGAIL